MLGISRDFYSDLYSKKETEDAAQQAIISDFKKRLTLEASDLLEQDYTLEQLKEALDSCKFGSSPGPDGLPFEFYRKTWIYSGSILLAYLNSLPLYTPEELPPSEFHIHLIHKKGNHSLMANKRPISILNTDQRLFSQVHNKRLTKQIHHLVAPTQTGFIPGRWIGSNVEEIQAAMDLEESHPGLLASMDFEKAYDQVSHQYLAKLLPSLGFGPKACSWYSTTFSNQTSKIYLNGWLSNSLQVLSGVRQGDPLAPTLFALAIEGFAAQLRKHTKGITSAYLPPLKELLFADDVSCFLRDYNDVSNLEQALAAYCQGSGARLNFAKSFLYPLGKFRHAPLLKQAHNQWTVQTHQFRCLGVQVGVKWTDKLSGTPLPRF